MSLRDLEASDKQYALMDKLGIEYDPQGVSVAEASKLIDAKLGKKPKDITESYAMPRTESALNKQRTGQSGGSNPSLGVPDKDAQFRTPTQLTRIDCLKAAVEAMRESPDTKEANAAMHGTPIVRPSILSLAEEFEKWVNR